MISSSTSTVDALKQCLLEHITRSLRIDTSHPLGRQYKDFSVLALLGKGSFGQVVLVCPSSKDGIYSNRSLFALKVISKEAMNTKSKERIQVEKEVLIKCRGNEWVIELYETFQDNLYMYLLLEFVPGGDLVCFLQEHGLFNEERAKFVVIEITAALETLHSLEYMHRDVKPGNILLDIHGHVKLADFGLCKQVTNGARSTSIVGTFDYIAPEVLQRRGYGCACDWWSLGALMYECLSGLPPFDADDHTATLRKIVRWYHYLALSPDLVLKMSSQSIDFLLSLLTLETKRLGYNGAQSVKSHPWLLGSPWSALQSCVSPLVSVKNREVERAMAEFIQQSDSSHEDLAGVKGIVSNYDTGDGGTIQNIPALKSKGKSVFRRDRNVKYLGFSYTPEVIKAVKEEPPAVVESAAEPSGDAPIVLSIDTTFAGMDSERQMSLPMTYSTSIYSECSSHV